jgi:hypothetical protein
MLRNSDPFNHPTNRKKDHREIKKGREGKRKKFFIATLLKKKRCLDFGHV